MSTYQTPKRDFLPSRSKARLIGVLLAPECREIFDFTVPSTGQLQPTHMPNGLATASSFAVGR